VKQDHSHDESLPHCVPFPLSRQGFEGTQFYKSNDYCAVISTIIFFISDIFEHFPVLSFSLSF